MTYQKLCLVLFFGGVFSLSGCANQQVGDGDGSFDDLQHKADQGNAEAQYEVGNVYWWNRDTNREDQARAISWYRKAAEQGHPEAQYRLATGYNYGLGVARDYHKASQWYRKAAEQGHVDAQYHLALLYESGSGVDQDVREADKWFLIAAKQGHIRAENAHCMRDPVCQQRKKQEAETAAELERQRKAEEARKLGERLGTIGIAVIPSSGRIVRKKLMQESQELADMGGGGMAGSTVYGGMVAGPIGAGGVVIVGATIGLVEGAQQLIYAARADVRQTKAAIKQALHDIKVSAVMYRHVVERVTDSLGAETVVINKPDDIDRIKDGDYGQIQEKPVKFLFVLNNLWAGLVGADDTATFTMEASIDVIDVTQQTYVHQQTLAYTGSKLELEKWIDNDSQLFLSELGKAYVAVSEKAVEILVEAFIVPISPAD